MRSLRKAENKDEIGDPVTADLDRSSQGALVEQALPIPKRCSLRKVQLLTKHTAQVPMPRYTINPA